MLILLICRMCSSRWTYESRLPIFFSLAAERPNIFVILVHDVNSVHNITAILSNVIFVYVES